LEQGRDLLTDVIEKITGLKVVTLHTDISTKTGERMIVFTLNKNLELLFRTQEAKLISKKGT
ncbi:MAG: Na-translocating system protein MpsC family protein, partial [Leptospirillum sp.]